MKDFPEIPLSLWVRYWLFFLVQIPLRILSIPLAPLVILTQPSLSKVAGWAKYFAPFDHDISGPNEDKMWRYWWAKDIEEYKSRSWYCSALRKAGVYGTAHPLVRYLQVMRNWGGTFNYRVAGIEAKKLNIVRYIKERGLVREIPLSAESDSEDFLYLAYSNKDSVSTIGNDPEGPRKVTVSPGATPVAFYRANGNRRFGWKLNYIPKNRSKWVIR